MGDNLSTQLEEPSQPRSWINNKPRLMLVVMGVILAVAALAFVPRLGVWFVTAIPAVMLVVAVLTASRSWFASSPSEQPSAAALISTHFQKALIIIALIVLTQRLIWPHVDSFGKTALVVLGVNIKMWLESVGWWPRRFWMTLIVAVIAFVAIDWAIEAVDVFSRSFAGA